MVLRLRSFQDLAEEILPTLRWLVDELLPGDGWTLLVAKPKTGKSLLAMQLAAALSRGGAFLGIPVEQRRVAYVQLDAPVGDWQAQVRLLPKEYREGPLTLDRRDLPLKLLDTNNVGIQSQLREVLKKAEVQLVIWDALEKLTSLDLNKKEGCQPALERLRSIFPGPAVVIHHPRKPSGESADALVDSASGNHYLTADASAIWGLVKQPGGKGRLQVLTRATDVKVDLQREPKTGLWLPAQAQAPEEGEKKYEWG